MTNRESQNEKGTGLYVHVPFCRSRCAYCAFVSSVGEYAQADYIRALEAEIAARVRGNIDTVFIGGGTPSVLERGLLTRIFDCIRRHASLAPNAEITVEANPDSFTPDFIREATACGVNRISLGVQSLSDAVLKAAGRRHTAAQAIDAVTRATQAFGNVSCDLMLGLPEQTEEDVLCAVDTLSLTGLSHLSLYALSVEAGTPLCKAGYAVNEDAAADWYAAAYERLKAHGFVRYEVSNFCRDGKACRHNLKYWRRAPYIGVGAAAHSFDGVARYKNTDDIKKYVAGERDEEKTVLSSADALEETIMLSLRTSLGADFRVLDELAGEDWKEKKREALDLLFDGGFIERTANGFRLAERAYYVMNEIIVKLL